MSSRPSRIMVRNTGRMAIKSMKFIMLNNEKQFIFVKSRLWELSPKEEFELSWAAEKSNDVFESEEANSEVIKHLY